MPERSSLNQVVQVGVETVPGTSVAANKRLTALSIEPTISSEIDTFRPAGQKYSSLTALGKEWVEADLSGRATYTELIYPLSSVIGTATMGANPSTNTRLWQFSSSSTADDVPKTFTVECGSSVRAHKFTHGIVNEFGISFSRDAIELSGSMIGRSLTDNITLTAAPTAVALVPVLPTEVTIYMDDTLAALQGGSPTKLTRALSAEWNIGSRFGPVWILDAANTGFVAVVETEPDLTLDLTVEADTQGMSLLTQLRSGATKFVRIQAVGTIAELAIAYRLTIDMACKLADTGGFSDEDGVYAIEWNMIGVHDASWGKAFQVDVINMLTAL
jgi:hypothetical protein